MDLLIRLIGLIVVVYVGLGLLAAFVAGLAAFLLLVFPVFVMGVMGAYYVKVKYPLVDGAYPPPVRILHAALWACGTTIALLFMSVFLFAQINATLLHQGMTDQMAQARAVELVPDALQFFAESALVIYGAATLSRRASLTAAAWPQALMLLIAAVTMTLPLVSALKVTGIGDFVVKEIGVLSWPVSLADTLVKIFNAGTVEQMGAFLVRLVTNWLIATKGNAYQLVSEVSKVLWLVAIWKWIDASTAEHGSASEISVSASAHTRFNDFVVLVAALVAAGACAALVWDNLLTPNPTSIPGWKMFSMLGALLGLWAILIYGRAMRMDFVGERSPSGLAEGRSSGRTWSGKIWHVPFVAFASALIVGTIARVVSNLLSLMKVLPDPYVETTYYACGVLAAIIAGYVKYRSKD